MYKIRHSAASIGFLASLVVVNGALAQLSAAPSDKERELIAVLRSDAPAAEKAMTCKHLAIHGSSAAVPELAKLLADEKLASWSRIALEAIPGSAADEALRKASESLKGNLLVGVINSIGVRRDDRAVDILSRRLQDQDAAVAAAAAVALGRIGDASSAKALRQALTSAPEELRSAVAEGCVLCAERHLAAGNSAEAAAIYDEVRQAEVPQQRRLEATRGAILARKQEGIPLLIEQLRSRDRSSFQMALSTAREFPGGELDKALADEVDQLAPQRAALVVVAMADRPQTVVLPAVLKAATSGPPVVRLSAIAALGRVGNDSCLVPLMEIALESDAELVQAAKEALAALPGQQVDRQIVARLSDAKGARHALLIELVGRRRIDAVPPLLKALNQSDPAVRTAALTALGNTIKPDNLSVLIDQVVTPTYADDAPVAQQALKTAAVRMPDREACAAEIAAAMKRSPVSTQLVLLDILSAVGGAKALAAVGAAAKSSDLQLQDAGSRLLGEWMTIDAAPVLLDVAKSEGRYQNRALRGYLRIARQFTMTPPERAEMCRQALAAAKQPAEKKLVLEILQRYPHLETLKVAVSAAQSPELKDDAAAAARDIAQRVPNNAAAREILAKAGLE